MEELQLRPVGHLTSSGFIQIINHLYWCEDLVNHLNWCEDKHDATSRPQLELALDLIAPRRLTRPNEYYL